MFSHSRVIRTVKFISSRCVETHTSTAIKRCTPEVSVKFLFSQGRHIFSHKHHKDFEYVDVGKNRHLLRMILEYFRSDHWI